MSATRANNRNLVELIMAYEQGDMNWEDVLDFFQYLVTSGLAWTLQGSYGRTAAALIDQGLITR